jgi:hypothetical protein
MVSAVSCGCPQISSTSRIMQVPCIDDQVTQPRLPSRGAIRRERSDRDSDAEVPLAHNNTGDTVRYCAGGDASIGVPEVILEPKGLHRSALPGFIGVNDSTHTAELVHGNGTSEGNLEIGALS